MGLFDQFNYTNFHELNLDWVVTTVKSYNAIIQAMKDEVDRLDKMYPNLAAEIYKTKTDLRNTEAKLMALISSLQVQINNFDFATRIEVDEKIAQVYAALSLSIQTLLHYCILT